MITLFHRSQPSISLAFRLRERASSIGVRTFLNSSWVRNSALNACRLIVASEAFEPRAEMACATEAAVEFRLGVNGKPATKRRIWCFSMASTSF